MQNFLIIFQIIPAIITALKAIEEAIPGRGQGEAKLSAVRQIIEAVDAGVGKLWPQINGVITALVNMFNVTGVFSKKPE